MPSPFLRARQVTSKPVDRPTPIAPVPEEYAGDNLPYRGTNNHGVDGSEDWRETSEDGPLRSDGRLVDVYEHDEPQPEPIPVYLVNQSSRERRAFRVVTAYAGGSNRGTARAVLGMDETRTKATIRCPEWGSPIYLNDAPETATAQYGFPLLAGATYQTESQEPVYAYCPASPDDQLTAIAVEYRISLDG